MTVTNRDKRASLTPGDVTAAIGLLSRLPVPVNRDKAMARGASAAWAYPLAGLVIGIVIAGAASLAIWVGLPGGVATAIALASSVIITGAMHEDGLSDAADGLWGGWDPERRLAIMKDSHIGVYGVCALILSFLLRWLVLSPFVTAGLHWPVILTAAMLSRANMVGLMALLPHARADGLSRSVGQPPLIAVLISAALALIATFYFWGLGGLIIALLAAIVMLICAAIARAKIGGQTGDILGATQQTSEIAILLCLLALISS